MSKGLEINVEIGLCTKDMAKENPIKDFEILIEEYKDKWSKQMYDYFKECLSIIEKELKALEIIKNKYLDPHDFVLCYYTMNNEKWIDYEEYKKAYLNYYENDEYMLTQEEYDLLKEVLL